MWKSPSTWRRWPPFCATVIAELKKSRRRTRRSVFYRGEDGDLSTPGNGEVYVYDKALFAALGNLIRHKRKAEAMDLTARLYRDIRRCEGTRPEVVRNIYLARSCSPCSRRRRAATSPPSPPRGTICSTPPPSSPPCGSCGRPLTDGIQTYFQAVESNAQDLVTRVDGYLAAHLADSDFTVQAMASDLGFVHTYLCSAYKKNSGRTVNQKLTELRMERAKALLADPSRKLYEVAHAVGYADGKYVVKLFTKEVGIPPAFTGRNFAAMKNKLRAFGRSLLLDVGLRGKLLCIFFLLLVLPLGAFTLYAFHRINTVIEEQTYSAPRKPLRTPTPLWRTAGPADPGGGHPRHGPLPLRPGGQRPRRHQLHPAPGGPGPHLYHLHLPALHVRGGPGAAVCEQRLPLHQLRRHRLAGHGAQQRLVFHPLPQRQRRGLVRPRRLCRPAGGRAGLVLACAPRLRPQPRAAAPGHPAGGPSPPGRVDAAVSRSTITQNGTVLLLNGAEVLSSSSPERAAQLSGSLPASSAGWVEADTSQGPFRVQSVVLEDCGWTLAAALPRDDIFRTSRQLRMEMLAVVVLLAAASYFLAYRLSQSITPAALSAHDTMHAVELGDVSARVAPQGRDEIGQLMGSFSNMMGRIDTLMDEKLEQGQQIKALELKALQAQINPHFLYNSLDLINCTAIAHNVPGDKPHGERPGPVLPSFLEPGQGGHPPGRTRLKHARLYVEIQNMRFEDRVRTEWDVEPGVEQCPIIKIVCSPSSRTPSSTASLKNRTRPAACASLPSGRGRTWSSPWRTTAWAWTRRPVWPTFPPAPPAPTPRAATGCATSTSGCIWPTGRSTGLSCESELGRGTRVTIRIPAAEETEDQAQ